MKAKLLTLSLVAIPMAIFLAYIWKAGAHGTIELGAVALTCVIAAAAGVLIMATPGLPRDWHDDI